MTDWWGTTAYGFTTTFSSVMPAVVVDYTTTAAIWTDTEINEGFERRRIRARDMWTTTFENEFMAYPDTKLKDEHICYASKEMS